MKLSGLEAVTFNKPISPVLQRVLACRYPVATDTVSVCKPGGLSGQALRISVAGLDCVARQQSHQQMPGVSLSRHYRVLKKLPYGIAPSPLCFQHGWLVLAWVDGDVLIHLPPDLSLNILLNRLHHQSLFGWRIQLLPQLWFYWQWGDPRRRTHYWLRTLKRIARRKEPRPLRLAPLHMDIHAGNIVNQASGITLIDWEYAGDGDVALELAALLSMCPERKETLLADYANRAKINLPRLVRQVNRWQPWVRLLMASWYEFRWQQTKDRQFLALADEAWLALRARY